MWKSMYVLEHFFRSIFGSRLLYNRSWLVHCCVLEHFFNTTLYVCQLLLVNFTCITLKNNDWADRMSVCTSPWDVGYRTHFADLFNVMVVFILIFFLCNLMLKDQKYSCAYYYCCAVWIFNFKGQIYFFDSVIFVFLHLMKCLQILWRSSVG